MFSNGSHNPLPGRFNQFAVAMEFINFTFVARQDADHGFTPAAQRGNRRTQAGTLTPRRANGRLQRARGGCANQRFQVEAERSEERRVGKECRL